MKRTIKNVAILGSGVMGSRIACHFANIGVQVLLLDIVPFELTEQEQKKGLTKEDPAVRNRLVNSALQSTLKSNPSAIYDKAFADRIQTGNFDDDLHKIKDYDWVMEVVVERLDIKQSLFEKVEKHRKPGTLITSNTSGIPMHMMCEGRSEDFQENFAGTHFFNPPRYLRLLEIIPGPKSKPENIEFLMDYGDRFLGKETVLCKDTPAFIANRVGVYAIISAMHTVEKMGLGVSEVDKMTGTVIGRAKSATFRTMDVVGLDTTVNVANNLYKALPNDESREKFKLPKIVEVLYENKWFGDKTGHGYFKMIRHKDGSKELKEIDFETFEYKDVEKPNIKALQASKEIEDLKKRIKFLVNFDDKAGEFYRTTFYDLFKYCSNRIPEISDELYRIDQAVCAGFGWELGPFETWDVLGVKETVEKMEAAGEKPAAWVYEMLEAGNDSFYQVIEGKKHYYDIPTKSYKEIPGIEEFIILDTLKSAGKKLWENPGASVYDMGDDVIGLEFHTKMNSMGQEVIEGINTAIGMAEKSHKGLVIGNEGANFSAGANLAMLFMFAGDQDFDEINLMIAQFQNTMMRARFSSIPVVLAPHNMALGGGCELSLHSDHIQAHAELYMGLVEVGVGLIPAGGGTKEMTLRFSNEIESGDVELNRLQERFMNIAMAKVSTSAEEARNLGYLRNSDGITLNRKRQLAEAKQKVISLYDQGYSQPVEQNIKVMGKSSLALFEAGITGMQYGAYISEHDAKIARKLAWVMSGGDLSSPTEVSERHLLDLEREAFLSLTGEKKTLERIHSILFKGKPLRN
ncbi:3-hydroxyacyl-CoA dehydrogenase/enoyl-CoA hydratase family protein [Algoriphagus machipongonensis]|uniref:3-hydroxyacyl-CoA dehydrogenase/enoyl-CoA hydratase/isomerase family protein n=1 Tax=Algoriphagus machipongonensis TaxID=388413 RepID=A3HUI1_9BACT|nr:3-hydroxyacyl-CoA dehydrogenase/enoyl-CoA hydratase family protein [Algoriphagus machipongonensis]EAZ81803.1 3-hydroxyacyl-CoA dehydrogenase/enoyl-CoA hydratase/isomerase family protein [Algoriphagus machipongonensis]